IRRERWECDVDIYIGLDRQLITAQPMRAADRGMNHDVDPHSIDINHSDIFDSTKPHGDFVALAGRAGLLECPDLRRGDKPLRVRETETEAPREVVWGAVATNEHGVEPDLLVGELAVP